MTIRSVLMLVATATVSGMLSACMTDGTTDLIEAPTRTSTGSTHATTDFTSSTSPGAWFTGDGTLKAEHKVRALTVFAFENVKGNIAQGAGEYVASLASLAGVPVQRREEFFRFAQDHYGFIYAEGIKPAESVDRLIQTLTGPASRM